MFERTNIFAVDLNREIAHGGIGEILTRRIVGANDNSSRCNFIDYTIVPPGSTIGIHTHSHREEEYYLILSGTGKMSCDGRVFTVSAGDLIRNPPGGTHGLENTGVDPITLFVFEVAVCHD